MIKLLLPVLALAPLAAPAGPDVAWDESLDGDLSGDPLAPTQLALAPGDNRIVGSVTTSTLDTRDYVTFTILAGQELTAIRQDVYVDVPGGGPGDRGYNAIAAGATSAIPDSTNGNLFLGGDHIDQLAPGTDLLAILATAPLAGTGFTAPLGPGTYTYHLQQTGQQVVGYELVFQVAASAAPVPASSPATLALLGLAFAAAGAWVLRGRAARPAAQ